MRTRAAVRACSAHSRAARRPAPRQLPAPPRAAPDGALGTKAASTASKPTAQVRQQLPEGFDLGLAVAMAAAAFEAYLEPSDVGFKEGSTSGTETTYCSRFFLQEAFEGVLEVAVEGAKGLKAVNLALRGGASDPYVVVSCGDSAARSEVVYGTTDPEWSQTLRIFVRDAAKDIVRVRVYDKSTVRSDNDLGVAMLAVAGVADGRDHAQTLELKGANGQGTITLGLRFLPFSEGANPMASALLDAATADGGPAAPPPPPPPEPGVMEEAAAAAGAAVDKLAVRVVGADAPAVGDAVSLASESAMGAIEGAASAVEAKLKAAGLDGKMADAVGSVKQAALERARAAASSVSGFVQARGIAGVPSKDLSRILGALTTSSDGKGKAPPPAEGGDALTAAEMPGAWKALAQVAGKALQGVFEPVAYVESPDTDTQVWLSRSVLEREVVISFRGTEQVKWKDILADVNLIPQALDVERTGAWDLNTGLGNLPMFKSFKRSGETMVHTGFLSGYDSVKAKVWSLLDALTSDASPGLPWRVYVTGHSLGGALATLCAYELAGRTPRTGPGSLQLHMYTFGAPRVGNRAFAAEFNARLGSRAWRITNASDIVPTVPRLMGYCHVQTGVRLTPRMRAADAAAKAVAAAGGGVAGAAAVMAAAAADAAEEGAPILEFDTSSVDVLGEGREVVEVISDLASKAAKVVKGEVKMDEVVDKIKDHEMQLLSSLMDGSALSQHMEDYYLMALREALLAIRPDLEDEVEAALDEVRRADEAASAGAPPTA